jgi:hypothetical protein
MPSTSKNLGDFRKQLDASTKIHSRPGEESRGHRAGLGTMIGWRRIVVTVGEKIGKSHMTYAQGASAELVAMTIFAADAFGLPVRRHTSSRPASPVPWRPTPPGLRWGTVEPAHGLGPDAAMRHPHLRQPLFHFLPPVLKAGSGHPAGKPIVPALTGLTRPRHVPSCGGFRISSAHGAAWCTPMPSTSALDQMTVMSVAERCRSAATWRQRKTARHSHRRRQLPNLDAGEPEFGGQSNRDTGGQIPTATCRLEPFDAACPHQQRRRDDHCPCHREAQAATDGSATATVRRQVLEPSDLHIPRSAIWIDLIRPTLVEEDRKVQAFVGVPVPTKADPIICREPPEAHYSENGVRYLHARSSSANRRKPDVTGVTVVIAPTVLVTVRYHPVETFDLFSQKL